MNNDLPRRSRTAAASRAACSRTWRSSTRRCPVTRGRHRPPASRGSTRSAPARRTSATRSRWRSRSGPRAREPRSSATSRRRSTILPSLTAQTTIGVDYNDVVRQTYIPRASPIGAAVRRARAPGRAQPAEPQLPAAADRSRRSSATSRSSRSSAATSTASSTNHGFEVDRAGLHHRRVPVATTSAPARRRAAPPPVSYDPGEQAGLVLRARELRLRGQVLPHRRRAARRLVAPRRGQQVVDVPGDLRLVAPERRGLHAERPLGFSHARAARGLGTSGQPGGAPVRDAAPAPRRAAAPAIRSAARSRRASRRRRSRTRTSSGRRRRRPTSASTTGFKNDRFTGVDRHLPEDDEGPAARRCRCRSRRSCRTRLENIGSLRNRGFEASIDAQLFEASNAAAQLGPRACGRAQRGDEPRRRPHVHQHGRRERPGSVGRVVAAHHRRRAARHLLGRRSSSRVNAAGQAGVQPARRAAPECVERRDDSRRRATTTMIIGNANPELHARPAQQRRDGASSTRAGCGAASSAATCSTTRRSSTRRRATRKQDRNFLASALDDPDRHRRAGDLLVALDRERHVRAAAERDGRLHVHAAEHARSRARTRASTCRATTCCCSRGYTGYDPEVFVRRRHWRRAASTTSTYPRARTFTTGVARSSSDPSDTRDRSIHTRGMERYDDISIEIDSADRPQCRAVARAAPMVLRWPAPI